MPISNWQVGRLLRVKKNIGLLFFVTSVIKTPVLILLTWTNKYQLKTNGE